MPPELGSAGRVTSWGKKRQPSRPPHTIVAGRTDNLGVRGRGTRRTPYPRGVHTTTKRPTAALPAALLVGLLMLALATLSPTAPAHAAPAKADGFFAATLVDRDTGKPVKGVTVKVYRINSTTLLGSATTGSLGRFRVNGIPASDEELEVHALGRAVGYQTGWFACNHTLVASIDDSCTFGQGRHGTPWRSRHL